MYVRVSNLYEDAAGLGHQVPCYRQPVSKVGQVGVSPIAPSIPKRPHLLGLARDLGAVAILDCTTCRRPLEVRLELDAVRRVEVDALYLAAQALSFGERRHHLEAVAEDHAVRPVGVVLVELGPRVVARQPVEVREQVGLSVLVPGLGSAPPCLALEVVYEHLGVHLLLDEQRRRLHSQLGRSRHVLAAPHELRVEVSVAPFEGDADGVLVGGVEHRLELGCRDVRARGCLMLDGRDPPGRRGGLALLGHPLSRSTRRASSRSSRRFGRLRPLRSPPPFRTRP